MDCVSSSELTVVQASISMHALAENEWLVDQSAIQLKTFMM